MPKPALNTSWLLLLALPSVFAVGLAAFGTYRYIVGNRQAQSQQIPDATIDLLEKLPASEVTGRISSLSGSRLTLNVDSNGYMADGLPDVLVFRIVPETEVTNYSPTDPDRYREEMQAYQEKLREDPGYQKMPPTPYEDRTVSVADLKERQTVSVSIEKGKGLVAERVVIRSPLDQ